MGATIFHDFYLKIINIKLFCELLGNGLSESV